MTQQTSERRETAGAEDRVYTVNEAAARLKVTPQTVQALCRSGELRARKVGRRVWRVSARSLDEFTG